VDDGGKLERIFIIAPPGITVPSPEAFVSGVKPKEIRQISVLMITWINPDVLKME